MSTSLPQRTKELHARLVALEQLGDNVREARQLDDLRSSLEPDANKMVRALNQCKLLADFGVEVISPPSLEIARKASAALLKRFTSVKKAATLIRGVGWTNLIERTRDASRDLGSGAVNRWHSYRQEIFTGEDPSVIRGRIAFTPANNAAFNEYERVFRIFRSTTNVPADANEIEHVRVLARALNEAAHAFDFNVPSEVKLFFEAVQGGVAELSLLTDDVRNWLKMNNAFESYRIVPRGNDGRR